MNQNWGMQIKQKRLEMYCENDKRIGSKRFNLGGGVFQDKKELDANQQNAGRVLQENWCFCHHCHLVNIMVLRVHPLRYVLDYPAASSIFPRENQQHLQESHIARVQDVQVFGVPRCKSPRRSRSQQLQAQQVEPQNRCLFCAQMWINPIQLLFCIWLGVTLVKIIQNLNGSKCDIPNIAKSMGLAHPFQPRPVPIPRCSLRLSTSPSWRFFRGGFRVLGVALILPSGYLT